MKLIILYLFLKRLSEQKRRLYLPLSKGLDSRKTFSIFFSKIEEMFDSPAQTSGPTMEASSVSEESPERDDAVTKHDNCIAFAFVVFLFIQLFIWRRVEVL